MPDDTKRQSPAPSQGGTRPRLDFQEHLADLEARGLLVRVERPINKDTELHPLVRWQFVGGIPEDERRAFLFTNVVDAKGRRYDMPVAVGALASSPRIYAVGMGRTVEDIGATWMRAIAHPIAPVTRRFAGVPAGRHHRRRAARARRRAREFAGADFNAGVRCRALSDGDAVRHARSRQRHSEHGHLPRRVEGDRPARRAHGRARRRRRRLPALAQVSRAQSADADRDRHRLRAGGVLHRSAETRRRHGRTRGGGRAGRRADPQDEMRHHRSRSAGGRGNRDRRRDRHRGARAGSAVRRKQRLRRARSVQHADARHRDHAQALAGVHLHHQPGHAERIERRQESCVRAAVSRAPARQPVDQEREARGDARAAVESAPGHLRAVCARCAAHRGVARACTGRRRCARSAARS